jgi:hypothetical protein
MCVFAHRTNRATFKSHLVCGEQEQIEEAGRELAKDFLPLLGAGDCLIEPEVDFEGSVNPTVPTDRGLQINHHAAIPLNGLGIGRQLRHRGSERAEVSFTIVWSISTLRSAEEPTVLRRHVSAASRGA